MKYREISQLKTVLLQVLIGISDCSKARFKIWSVFDNKGSPH